MVHNDGGDGVESVRIEKAVAGTGGPVDGDVDDTARVDVTHGYGVLFPISGAAFATL